MKGARDSKQLGRDLLSGAIGGLLSVARPALILSYCDFSEILMMLAE